MNEKRARGWGHHLVEANDRLRFGEEDKEEEREICVEDYNDLILVLS